MIFLLDTNVLLRFLVGDNKPQQERAVLWFKEAEQGKRKIFVSPLIVAEAVFVLESFYKKDRQEIAEALELFLSQRWLQIEQRDILLGLWKWYRKGLHFVDCFLISSADVKEGRILTFDHQLEKQKKED